MSACRRCDIWKATDGQYYVTVGNFEHAHDEDDCSTYGPFDDSEAAFEYARNTGPGNPGGCCTDDSGTQPPPASFTRPRRGFY